MTATLMAEGRQSYADSNGNPLAGGRLYTYAAGTSTPLATYSDAAGLVPNANPVVLDARGEATVFWGSAAYKVVLKDAADVTVWTQDDLTVRGLVTATGAATARTIEDHLATLPDSKVTATGSTTPRTLAVRFTDSVQAADFGASPAYTAVTNRAAIQAAIDYVESIGGGTVTLGRGTYDIGAYLVLKSGVTLQGMGVGVSTIRGSVIRQVIIANAITHFGLRDLTVTTDGTDGIIGVELTDSTFGKLSNLEIKDTTYIGMFIDGSSDIQISNLTVKNVLATTGGTVGGTGLHLFDGTTRVTVNGLVVDGTDGTGVWLDAQTTGGAPHPITDCTFSGMVIRDFTRVIGGAAGFATQGAQRCSGSGWTIGPAASPTAQQSSGVILNTDQSGTPTTDCVFTGITIEKCGAAAVKILSSQRNQLSNVRVLDAAGSLVNYAVLFDEGTVSGGVTRPDNLDNVVDGLDVATSGAPYSTNYSRTVLFNGVAANCYRNRVESIRPGVPTDVVAYWNGANAPSAGANANVATYLDKDALTLRHSAPVRAAGFTSSDGSVGLSATLTVKGSDGNSHTLTVKNGLITATDLP